LAHLPLVETGGLGEVADGTQVTLCGMNAGLKEITTKKGERMAFLTLEDRAGSVEVVIFTDVFQASQPLLERDEPLLLVGTVQQEEKGAKVLAQRLLGLADAKEQMTQAVRLRLPLERVSRSNLEDLKAILERHPGECRAYIHLVVDPKCETIISLGEQFRVKPSRGLVEEINGYFQGPVVTTILGNGGGQHQPRSRAGGKRAPRGKRSGSLH
jgi:DNA polymerase-3 subunit alpha